MTFTYWLEISTEFSDKYLNRKKGKKYEIALSIDGVPHILTIAQLKKALKQYKNEKLKQEN